MEQLTLGLEPITDVHHHPGDSIDVRFARFHEENPHVYDMLVSLARQLKANGAKRIGIKMLFEVLRWQYAMKTSDSDGFCLNNTLHSRYARLIMEHEPDLEGIFELRHLRSE